VVYLTTVIIIVYTEFTNVAVSHMLETHGVEAIGIYDQYCTLAFNFCIQHPSLFYLATVQILHYAQEMERQRSITL